MDLIVEYVLLVLTLERIFDVVVLPRPRLSGSLLSFLTRCRSTRGRRRYRRGIRTSNSCCLGRRSGVCCISRRRRTTMS